MMQSPSEHSILGGSGAYRWLNGNCIGSVRLAVGVPDPESEYASEGTMAHSLAEHCLLTGTDAWEHIGKDALAEVPLMQAVTREMANAVQVYLDDARSHDDEELQCTWVEKAFHAKHIHPLMYGRVDRVAYVEPKKLLRVVDYKHGAGIVVDVERNPQLMYYACGIIEELGLWSYIDEIELTIVQPRGWMDPVRTWTLSIGDLENWLDGELVPRMNHIEMLLKDGGLTNDGLLALGLLNSGEHCRFCPARFRDCPQMAEDEQEMRQLMEALEQAGGAAKLTNDQVGRILELNEVLKIRMKAVREVGHERAIAGADIPGQKLVPAKTNREWKEDAERFLEEKYGDDAYQPLKLRSPAEVEKLPGGKAMTTKYAFKPPGGLQLVPESDKRKPAGPGVKSMFKPVKELKGL